MTVPGLLVVLPLFISHLKPSTLSEVNITSLTQLINPYLRRPKNTMTVGQK